MKNMKILVVILLMIEASFSIAQTSAEKDKELNEKYWIYRDRFRKRFVNVGKLDGQSLPFIRIFEGYNTTVLDSAKLLLHIPDSQKEKGFSGSMSKGEMGIELCNYIILSVGVPTNRNMSSLTTSIPIDYSSL